MSAPAQCEMFLLRYMPDVVKGEFINVGIVFVQSDFGGAGSFYADVRFTSDYSRVRCLDPGADVEMLRQLEADIRGRLKVPPNKRAELLRQIQDSLSNTIQISEPKACLTSDPAHELDQLAESYLERNRRAASHDSDSEVDHVAETKRSSSARNLVLRKMRRAFEDAGVWPLMQKKMPVAQYTFSNDPLKIDCGYFNTHDAFREGEFKSQRSKVKSGEANDQRPTTDDRALRLFHAIAFDPDATSSKALAFTFPDLRAGIQREHHAAAELTAIVAEDYDKDDDTARFAINILRKSEIKLATTADLAMLAEHARKDLRL